MSIRMSRNIDKVVLRAGREYEITDRRLIVNEFQPRQNLIFSNTPPLIYGCSLIALPSYRLCAPRLCTFLEIFFSPCLLPLLI